MVGEETVGEETVGEETGGEVFAPGHGLLLEEVW
jgi:hypothetical protein